MTDAPDNRRSPWPFWTAVGSLVVFVIYPLSLGPAIFLGSRLCDSGYIEGHEVNAVLERIYLPLVWLMDNGPRPIEEAVESYIELWMDLG